MRQIKTLNQIEWCSEKSNELIGLWKLNQKLNGALKQSLKEIKGKIGDLSIIQTFGTIPANKILLEGIGPKNKITTDILRMVSGNISQIISEIDSVTILEALSQTIYQWEISSNFSIILFWIILRNSSESLLIFLNLSELFWILHNFVFLKCFRIDVFRNGFQKLSYY